MIRTRTRFFGWNVAWAAAVVAMFGYGVGFYGPPAFLLVLTETRGWSIALVSSAISVHFLLAAAIVANMPAIHRRFGLCTTTTLAAVTLGLGVVGWALAETPLQLFAATAFTAAGYAGTGPYAINAMISPWFSRRRPAALAIGYNGASVGGAIFSPLWILLIGSTGFPVAAMAVGAIMALVVSVLSFRMLRVRPERRDAASFVAENPDASARPHPGASIQGPAVWRDRRFLTLTAGFSIGLFAQIGVVSHLISSLAPVFGAQGAGLAAGLATASAIVGRLASAPVLRRGFDRRLAGALTYGVQILGGVAVMVSDGSETLIIAGVVLFGLGMGNVTSLPPLIAQTEFSPADVPRVIALATALSQATFAFAPGLLSLVRGGGGVEPVFFALVVGLQALAALVYLAGRHSPKRSPRSGLSSS